MKMTTTLSSKFQIVIPKEVRQKLNLIPGQQFQVTGKGGIIVIKHVKIPRFARNDKTF